MSKLDELLNDKKLLVQRIVDIDALLSRVSDFGESARLSVLCNGYNSVAFSGDAAQQLTEVITKHKDRVQDKLTTVNDQLAKAEAVLNPPPEPTIFDTPNTWFTFAESSSDGLYGYEEVFYVGVCTEDEWNDFCSRGKQGDFCLHVNIERITWSVVQDVKIAIELGLRVSGNPCAAVIVIKRVE